MSDIDPLRSALHEATLAVLLGSTSVPHQMTDMQGNSIITTITIPSAFGERIRSKAFSGEFDDLIHKAMEQVNSAAVARAIESVLAEQIIAGLQNRNNNSWDRTVPNWLQAKAMDIAVAACTEAMKTDEELLDTLRTKIGSEVDRNRVGITVNLSNPEGN